MPEVKYVDIVNTKFNEHKTNCCSSTFTRIDGIERCDSCSKDVRTELVFHMKSIIQEQADLIADKEVVC